jgi:hypothetical protein
MKKLYVLLLSAFLFGLMATVHAQDFSLGEKKSELKKASAFPNPFKGKLTIKCESTADVYVYDSFGRLTHQEKIKDGSTTINTLDDKVGLYMIVVLINKADSPLEKETIKVAKE